MSSNSPKGDSVSTTEAPPDRSASSSAPPALELATESLFAFTVQYANIFSDIRAHEDYYNFYETYGQTKKLPPPLEAAPFVFETGDDDEEFHRRKLPTTRNEPIGSQLQGFGTASHNIPPQSNMWNPTPRKSGLSQEIFSEGRNEMLQMNLTDSTFGSSPSAETPFNSAKYIWNDEEQSNHPPKIEPVELPHLTGGYAQANQPGYRQGAAPGGFNGMYQYGFGPLVQPPVQSPANGNQTSLPRATNRNVSAQPSLNGSATLPSRPEPSLVSPSLTTPSLTTPPLTPPSLSSAGMNAPGRPTSAGPDSEETPRNAVACRYYAAGYCSRGDKCFYAHVTPNGQAAPAEEEKREKRKPKGFARASPNGRAAPASVTPPNLAAIAPTSSTHTPPSSVRQISPRPSTYSPRQLDENEELTNFEQLVGRIYSVSRDQQGCRLLQKKLEEKDPEVINIIFTEIYDHIDELMTDPFGNYLCQKLLEHCSDDQRYLIVRSVAPHLVSISKNMHGTRAVQKMIESLSSTAQVRIGVGWS